MLAPASEDDLKRRARRRLIGAVALTLVAVIVLPLMLEDKPPPAAQLQVHMPANTKRSDFVPIAPVYVAPVAPIPQAPVSTDSSPSNSETVVADAPIEKHKPAAEVNPKPAGAIEVKKLPKPNPPLKTESKPAVDKSAGFVVQLGAFSDAAKTAGLKHQVDDLGMSCYTDKSGALTRLRVGPFSSREAAAEAAAKLSAAGVQGQVMPK